MSEMLNEIEELGIEVFDVVRTEETVHVGNNLMLTMCYYDNRKTAMLKHRLPCLSPYYWPIKVLEEFHDGLANVISKEKTDAKIWIPFEEMSVRLKRILL